MGQNISVSNRRMHVVSDQTLYIRLKDLEPGNQVTTYTASKISTDSLMIQRR